MRELLIWRRSIIGILIFRNAEVEEANGNKEKGGEEAEDGTPIRSPYQHQVLSLYDGMNRHSKDS